MSTRRRAGIAAAVAAAQVGLAYRFAIAYRKRAGYPQRRAPVATPADLGMPFEGVHIPVDGLRLPAWFIPARDGAPGPGVVLVHGWESARDRTLPMAQFLHAAGFHCLTFDVRGHGANDREVLPISGGEFARDTLAAFEFLVARPEVTTGAVSGHSMGALGAVLAAAADRRIAALVLSAAPADPLRLTRLTFDLAGLPIPDPVAYPLAWLTARVYLRPRGHRVAEVDSIRAVRAYEGPLLLAHGALDAIVPLTHFERLRASAVTARAGRAGAAPFVDLVIEGGHHSWLYESETYRRSVARFLAQALGGPYPPDRAADLAAAVAAQRLREPEEPYGALANGTGVRAIIRSRP